MFRMLASLAVLSFCGNVARCEEPDDELPVPMVAKDTEEVLTAVEKIYAQSSIKITKENMFTVQYQSPEARAFVVWYYPYAVKNACRLLLYQWDLQDKKWYLMRSSDMEGGPNDETFRVAVEVSDQTMRARNAKQQIVLEQRLLPRTNLSRQKVFDLAHQAATSKGYKLTEFQPPLLNYVFQEQKWSVFYEKDDDLPGNHFSVFIEDKTENVKLRPGS